VDQLPLHLSIGFFALQVAAWASLCGHLYFKHRRAGGFTQTQVELVPIAVASAH